MTEIIEKCNSVISELLKFSEKLTFFGPSISDDRIEVFERQVGYIFPVDFKFILKKYNGISLDGTEVYGIDAELQGCSLDALYEFEHDLADNPMPPMFLPFSPDGFGNHYCLDLSKLSDGLCPVVFWQHDYSYDSVDEAEICNYSFFEWIKEVMIDWTLQDYNYDGSEK